MTFTAFGCEAIAKPSATPGPSKVYLCVIRGCTFTRLLDNRFRHSGYVLQYLQGQQHMNTGMLSVPSTDRHAGVNNTWNISKCHSTQKACTAADRSAPARPAQQAARRSHLSMRPAVHLDATPLLRNMQQHPRSRTKPQRQHGDPPSLPVPHHVESGRIQLRHIHLLLSQLTTSCMSMSGTHNEPCH